MLEQVNNIYNITREKLALSNNDVEYKPENLRGTNMLFLYHKSYLEPYGP